MPPAPPPPMDPTAVQLLAEAHEMSLIKASALISVRWTRHTPLCQRSMIPTYPGLFALCQPTAKHSAAEGHDTALRMLADGSGLGVAWTDHVPPSQRSARVSSFPDASSYRPTSVQLVAAEQETPYRALDVEPAGLGVACIAQALPSQCSVSA